MKTYRHLWDEFISPENFDLAAKKAVRGKKSKHAIRAFMENHGELLGQLREWVARGEFKTSQYRVKQIFEPKQRLIYVLPLYPDHIVHHALINILGPIWQREFIQDSYACIPGRGLHAASRRTMHFVRRNQFVLQCDIRKFYPSMRHNIMMNIIRRKITDKKILQILDDIVCSVGGGCNIPIGNLTSQWMGNVYLNELDQFIKQTLHWHDYIRYCDDFCLFGNDASVLHDAANKISIFLGTHLGLRYSKCVVRHTTYGVDFIGYRHFPNFILLRRRTAYRLRRRVLNIMCRNDKSARAVGQIASLRGWLKWACTYNYRCNIMRNI